MSHACICDWLGLPAEAWPPDHYRLLGLPLGEGDAARIEQQVHDRLEVVRRYQLLHPDHVTEAMNRLAQAFVCLTDPQAKGEYDAKLLQKPAEAPAVDEAIAEAPAVNSADPLAWLYSQEAQAAAATRAVTQLDVPAAEFRGPPENAETRGPDSAPPVRRPVALPPSGNGDAATAVTDQHDSIVEAASTSAPARRGLGTKRALYHRIARTRQLLRIWYEVGQFLGHPGRRLVKPVEATDLIHGLITLRTELKSFPPLLGQAGQPGYLVIALARQQVIVPTFQTLLPSQREALARDWRAGLKLLDAHLQFLRQELRVMRRRGLLGRVTRGLGSLLHGHFGLLLASLMILALVIAFCRSVGAEWMGELLESADEPPAHASAGAGPRADGFGNPARVHPRSDRENTPVKKDERPLAPDHEPWKVGPPEPPEVDPLAMSEKTDKPRRFQANAGPSCVSKVAFFSNDQFLSYSNGEPRLLLWDLAAKRPDQPVDSIKLSGSTTSVAVCSKTRQIACGNEAGEVLLISEAALPRTREPLEHLHAKAVSALAFSDSGNWLVSGGKDGKVVLWDLRDGSKNQILVESAKEPVQSVAISKDGRFVICGHNGGVVRFWDVKQGLNEALGKHKEAVCCLVVTPDGSAAFGGGKDGVIWRWDFDHIGQETKIGEVSERIESLVLSPDGRRLFSSDGDKKIRLWDVRTNDSSLTIKGPYDLPCSLAVSPNGKHILSGHADGALWLWPLPSPTPEEQPTSK